MKKICLGCLLLMAIVFVRCSTDVDLIAPYKETTVVYGLLNPSDSIQFIRVAKAYLGEGNALVMAKENDSIYYPDAAISVVLQRWKNSNLLDSVFLVRDVTIQKDPGIFSTQPNVLYRTVKDPVNHSDSIYKDSQYKLRIYNKLSGNEVTASTVVVGDISISIPLPNSSIQLSMTSQIPSTVRWYTATNGKVYNLIIRFNYEEKDLSTLVTTLKSADWNFQNIEVSTLAGTQLELTYNGEDFYKNLAAKIKEAPGVERKALKLDFVFTIGADEFYTYYLVNQPSLSINQNVPQYSNIKNGIGIFSSRNVTKILNKELDSSSLDSLRHGQYTGRLSFI